MFHSGEPSIKTGAALSPAALAAAMGGLLSGDRSRRNDTYVDFWSWLHLLLGVSTGWIMDEFWALFLLILWEPVEIFVLSPLIWRLWQVEFGFESFRNSLSDIVFDAAGVVMGAFLLRWLVAPPFILFD